MNVLNHSQTKQYNDGAETPQNIDLARQKFCHCMINDECQISATYFDHHTEPVCNFYLNLILGKLMRNTTEICAPFFCKQSVINNNNNMSLFV